MRRMYIGFRFVFCLSQSFQRIYSICLYLQTKGLIIRLLLVIEVIVFIEYLALLLVIEVRCRLSVIEVKQVLVVLVVRCRLLVIVLPFRLRCLGFLGSCRRWRRRFGW